MTPIDMSALKAERDRATQAAFELANRQYQYRMQVQQQQLQRTGAASAAAALVASQQRPGQPGAGMHRQGSQPNPNAPARFAGAAAGTPTGGSQGSPPSSQAGINGHASSPQAGQTANPAQGFSGQGGQQASMQGRVGTPSASNAQQAASHQQPVGGQLTAQPPSSGYSVNLAAMAGQLSAGNIANLQPDQVAQLRALLASRMAPGGIASQPQQQSQPQQSPQS